MESTTIIKPSFTIEQLRRKRGRYEEVNGVICKWCADCHAFLPVEAFDYSTSLGRHTASCRTCEAQRVVYQATPEGQKEAKYWQQVAQKGRERRKDPTYVPKPRKHSCHQIVGGELKKTCTTCEKLLSLDQFKKNGKHLRSECRDCHADKQSIYRQNHRANHREYKTKRYATDLRYRLIVNFRNYVIKALNGSIKKGAKTMDLLGCSIPEAKIHLESLFQPGMTWENWGTYRRNGPRRWQIDHIRPIASFDLTDPEQQKQCFHWTNLQPLWALDNLIKNGTWEGQSV